METLVKSDRFQYALRALSRWDRECIYQLYGCIKKVEELAHKANVDRSWTASQIAMGLAHDIPFDCNEEEVDEEAVYLALVDRRNNQMLYSFEEGRQEIMIMDYKGYSVVEDSI